MHALTASTARRMCSGMSACAAPRPISNAPKESMVVRLDEVRALVEAGGGGAGMDRAEDVREFEGRSLVATGKGCFDSGRVCETDGAEDVLEYEGRLVVAMGKGCFDAGRVWDRASRASEMSCGRSFLEGSCRWTATSL
jgi:hypothetical protein